MATPVRPGTAVAVWAIAIAGAALALAVLCATVATVQAPASGAFRAHNAARLERLADAPPGVLRVVALGSSRLRFGTVDDNALSDLVSRRAGRRVSVVRVVNNRATFADFEPLIEDLVAAEPHLVLIEETLRSKNPSGFQPWAVKREYVLWRLAGVGEWNPGAVDQDALQTENDCFADTEDAATDVLAAARVAKWDRWLDFDPNGPAVRALAQFEAVLTRQGIDVRYLVIPDTRRGAVLLARHRVDGAEAAVFGVAEPTRVWSPDATIPDEHFCDLIHLDHPGRIAYSDWLSEQLAQWVANQEG